MNHIQITINTFLINLDISEDGIHIHCDKGLIALIEAAPIHHVRMLSLEATKAFEARHAHVLGISIKSLMIEIWAHYYLLYIQLPKLKWMYRWKLFRPIIQRLTRSAAVFDCATFPTDKNRWIWDIASWIYPVWEYVFFRKHRK